MELGGWDWRGREMPQNPGKTKGLVSWGAVCPQQVSDGHAGRCRGSLCGVEVMFIPSFILEWLLSGKTGFNWWYLQR